MDDLFSDDSPIVRSDHGGAAARENGSLLEELSRRVDELEPYLRAYERLAGDEFYTGYFKRRFQKAVRFLALRNVISRQDTLDFFQATEDVLKAAERVISGSGDARAGRAVVSGDGLVLRTGKYGVYEVHDARSREGRNLPYVFVHTFPKPNEPGIRLARVTWASASALIGGVPPVSLAIENEPMGHEEALTVGRKIAGDYGFPYV